MCALERPRGALQRVNALQRTLLCAAAHGLRKRKPERCFAQAAAPNSALQRVNALRRML